VNTHSDFNDFGGVPFGVLGLIESSGFRGFNLKTFLEPPPALYHIVERVVIECDLVDQRVSVGQQLQG